jgi:hypothetical protein
MTDRLSPAFHAEYIVELFDTYGCAQKVREQANILLSSYPPEHVEAIIEHLPSNLIHVLPKRKVMNRQVR